LLIADHSSPNYAPMYGSNRRLQFSFLMDDILLLSRDISNHVKKLLEIVLKIDVKALSTAVLCVLMIR